MAEEDKIVLFVMEVEKYPCLYNYNLPEYSRRNITEKAWAAIAKETNSSVQTCKEKWKNLRSVFVRKQKSKSGDGRKSEKPYYLSKYMQFLIPFIKSATPATGNVPSPPNIYDDSQGVSEQSHLTEEEIAPEQSEEVTPQQRPKKRKFSSEVDKAILDFFRGKKETNDNPRKCFLLSLLPEVEELNESQFWDFKRRSLALLDDIRSCYPDTLSGNSSISSPGSHSSFVLGQSYPPTPIIILNDIQENSTD